MLKDIYSEYYTANGGFRKHLLKQESVNTAEMYDYFSKLEIRCRRLMRCNELMQTSNPIINGMVVKVGEFVSEMTELSEGVFNQDGEKLHKLFADLYDECASITEGFELEASKFLNKITVSLSESAKLIQRHPKYDRSHSNISRRSSTAKMSWRSSRGRMLAGIRNFHKSSAGKAFHRNLARFSRRKAENNDFTKDDILMTCKGISSMLTHAIIEVENYFTNSENLDEKVMQEAQIMREFFHIFNEALCCLFDAYFEDDKEAIADVLDIVKDYYDVTGSGDRELPDTDGVAGVAFP